MFWECNTAYVSESKYEIKNKAGNKIVSGDFFVINNSVSH